MRTRILIVLLISSVAVKSQTSSAMKIMDSLQGLPAANNAAAIQNNENKKWFFNIYKGLSTSYNFFNGGSAFVVAAPIGLQLDRKLTNNLYAFGGVSVAPAYVSFNRTSFMSANVNKMYPNSGMQNSFGLYSRAEMGLMYVNDAKTFSISGSFGIERGSNQFLPYQQFNQARSNQVISTNR